MDLLLITDENVKRCVAFLENSFQFLKKLSIELLYDSAMSLLGMCPSKIRTNIHPLKTYGCF